MLARSRECRNAIRVPALTWLSTDAMCWHNNPQPMHYARDGLGGDSSNGLLACLSRAMSGSSPASPAIVSGLSRYPKASQHWPVDRSARKSASCDVKEWAQLQNHVGELSAVQGPRFIYHKKSEDKTMNVFQEHGLLLDLLYEGEITHEEYEEAMDEIDPDHDLH